MDRDFNLAKKPVTPLVGVDVFIPDSESRVLLIKRTDNGFWCTPGGSQDLGETPEECGVREVLEETGFEIKINRLLGVFISLKYESVNYPWKGREYLHCFFMGEIIGGVGSPTDEAEEIGWFYRDQLPQLNDRYELQINYGFDFLENAQLPPYFE